MRKHEGSMVGFEPESRESTGTSMGIPGEQRQLNRPVTDTFEPLWMSLASFTREYGRLPEPEWSAWSGCFFGWMQYIAVRAMPTEYRNVVWQINLVIPDLPAQPPAGGGDDAQDTYEVYDGSQKSSLAANAPEEPESSGGTNAWGILSIPLLGEEYVWRVRSSDDYRKTVSVVQNIFKGGPQPCCP